LATALVNGGGVAALCCAKLLGDKAWEVTLNVPPHRPSPTLVLHPLTVHLLDRVFGRAGELLRGAHRLKRRRVSWGGAPPEVVALDCVVIRGDALTARLLAALEGDAGRFDGGPAGDGAREAKDSGLNESRYDWAVHAGGRVTAALGGAGPVMPRRFGERRALVSPARLRKGTDERASWMESTPAGWLFLTPLGGGRAVLQAVVPDPQASPEGAISGLLRSAKSIGSLVSDVTGPAEVFDCAPRLLESPSGARWIATGRPACAYDPLCGDGTGYSVRGAILTAAVLDAVARGAERARHLEYYRDRLAHAFYGHLRACHSFYSAGGFDETWLPEINATADGLRRLGRSLASRGPLRYGLRGLELVAL